MILYIYWNIGVKNNFENQPGWFRRHDRLRDEAPDGPRDALEVDELVVHGAEGLRVQAACPEAARAVPRIQGVRVVVLQGPPEEGLPREPRRHIFVVVAAAAAGGRVAVDGAGAAIEGDLGLAALPADVLFVVDDSLVAVEGIARTRRPGAAENKGSRRVRLGLNLPVIYFCKNIKKLDFKREQLFEPKS